MEDIKSASNYSEFKAELDNAMHQAAESFVKIGYLLRKAKDTTVLYESGYPNVNDFAKAEYGITPDQVSRYIRINERFSVNGYGQQLREDMQGYGIGKLQIMLTMSDEVVEAIPQELPKAEVQDIQREIKEEQKKTDIEVALETPEPVTGSMLQQFVLQYFHDNIDQYEKVYKSAKTLDGMLDIIAPSGVALLRTRIKGIGILMLSIKGADQPLELVNARTNEKQTYAPNEIVDCFAQQFVEDGFKAKYRWMEVFNEDWPQKEEPVKPKEEKIAPVQTVMKETKEDAPDSNVGNKQEPALKPKSEESGSKVTKTVDNVDEVTESVSKAEENVDEASENEIAVEETVIEDHVAKDGNMVDEVSIDAKSISEGNMVAESAGDLVNTKSKESVTVEIVPEVEVEKVDFEKEISKARKMVNMIDSYIDSKAYETAARTARSLADKLDFISVLEE